MHDLLIQLKAAAEETRLRILAICAHGELTVTELTHILGQSQPRVSRHLKLLCDANLLHRFREGAWVFYRRAEDADAGGAGLVDSILARIPENDPQFRRDMQRLAEVRKNRQAAAEAYFRENAAEWDRLRSLHVDETEVEEKMLTLISAKRDQSLIDIGTGTGRILELLGRGMARGVGIDLSHEMLSLARNRLDGAGLRECQVRHGDMYQLPADDADFDIATLHLVLHYADDPSAVIQEAARAIVPGGRLVIVDFAPHEVEELRVEHAHRRLGFSDIEIQDLLAAAGLNLSTIESLPGDPLTVKIWIGQKQPADPSVFAAVPAPAAEKEVYRS
ncbi:MAG: ArsR/SmtB family transcription factor [Alphaproteobacteria bacterium]